MAMLYLIPRLNVTVYRDLLLSKHTARCAALFVRSYSRQRHRPINSDPRKNVRYPYVQGDPIQIEAIKDLNKNSAMSKLKDKDKGMNNTKKKNMKTHSSVYETVSGLLVEKLKEGDTRLGHTILAAKSNSRKGATDTILLEGQRLIRDALLLGAQAKSIYFCDPAVLNSLPTHLLKDVGLYKILYRDMKTWSDATTPAGILGVFRKPQQGEAISVAETTLPISLILDSLKDPGNVGTLIRTAAAVGCERIIVTKGTVNVWDCKVLRSAMGGHFSVPIYTGLSWADIPNYLNDNTQVFLANTWQSSMLSRSFDEKLQSEELDRALDESESSESDSDSESYGDSEFHENEISDLLAAEKHAQAFQKVPLAICEYSEINLPYSNNFASGRNSAISVAIVLGGETEGLSAQAKKFAYRHYGQYLSIPMNTTVNSLNTGIAGSIILYELRRKLLAMEHGIHTGTGILNK